MAERELKYEFVPGKARGREAGNGLSHLFSFTGDEPVIAFRGETMLKKFCDDCKQEMPLNGGFEVVFRISDLRAHFCSWPCVRSVNDDAGQHLESVKNLNRGVKSVVDEAGNVTFKTYGTKEDAAKELR